jgi:hypothetical protein
LRVAIFLVACSSPLEGSVNAPAGAEARDLGSTGDRESTLEDIGLKRRMCAINSLYAFLRLCEIEVTFDTVCAALGDGFDGSDLVQLRVFAARFGLETSIVRFSDATLQDCPLPMLVHIPPNRAEERNVVGHFVVVLSVGDERVRFLDGTSGEDKRVRTDWLLASSSGYALVPTSKQTRFLRTLGLFSAPLMGAAILVLLALDGRRRKTIRRARPSSALLTALMLLGLGASSLAATETTSVPPEGVDGVAVHAWRCAENDGHNCLYLLLRFHGRPATYQDVKSALHARTGGRPCSFLDLKEVAGSLGLRTQILRLSPGRELYSRMPLIVHRMNPQTSERGFALLHDVGSGDYRYISGGFATFERVSADQFRRQWSATVLAVDTRRPVWRYVLLCVGVGIVFWVSWRTGHRLQSRVRRLVAPEQEEQEL